MKSTYSVLGVALVIAVVLFVRFDGQRVPENALQESPDDFNASQETGADAERTRFPTNSETGDEPASGEPDVATSTARSIIALPEITDEPIASEYFDLVERAQAGDFRASFTLWKKLGRCRGKLISDTALEEKIMRMRQTFQIEDFQTGERYGVNEIAPHIERMLNDHRFCAELTPETAEEAYEWLELAAEQGFIPAIVDYATAPNPLLELNTPEMQAYRDKRGNMLDDAWNRGSVDALFWISIDMLNGITRDRNLAGAYARMKSVSLLSEETGQFEGTHRLVGQLGAHLSPRELQEAEQEARELVTNSNCCKFVERKEVL